MIKQEVIFSLLSAYNLFNNSSNLLFLSNSNNSIPPIIKQELYSHKIALYKKHVNSSFVVSLLHNKTVWATGLFSVRYLYIWNKSFSSLSHKYKYNPLYLFPLSFFLTKVSL